MYKEFKYKKNKNFLSYIILCSDSELFAQKLNNLLQS